MCGLAGFVSFPGRCLLNSRLKQMIDIVDYRGPDDQGFLFISDKHQIRICGSDKTPPGIWVSSTEYCPEFNIKEIQDDYSISGIGHNRLSIIDLSPKGHQPMSYRNSKLWIVFNGEIYNHNIIRKELEACGCVFTTKSDTEVILAAYSVWGTECVQRFAGMWSFAIFDLLKKEIFLSRDRFAIKPLYYWFSDGNFYFASEIKQFSTLDGWNPEINPSRVYDQLIYSFTDHTDETMFKGVYHLPGGTYYKSSIYDVKPDETGRIKYRKWYNINRNQFKGSFNEAALIFRNLFEQAVSEHMIADVPLGTALSGGLDSSSIVCEINRLLDKKEIQKTFSSCAKEKRFDEKDWMDIVIQHTNIDASYVFPQMAEAIELTPTILWHLDEPYQSQSVFLGYKVFQLASQNGIKVLLNGQGADEYLGGYGQFTMARYASLIKKFRLYDFFHEFNLNHSQISYSSLLRGVLFQAIPHNLRYKVTERYSTSKRVREIFDLKKLMSNYQHPYLSIPVPYNNVPEISEHLTFYSSLPKYLRWEDRISMAHSVEARVPFLDHRLVEFSYNLPDDFLDKDGWTKRIMREAMKGLLPEKIRMRRDKKGFITPEEHWVLKENPGLYRKKIAEAISITNGIIKSEALSYFDDVVGGKLPFDYTYWRIILFSEWIIKFGIKI